MKKTFKLSVLALALGLTFNAQAATTTVGNPADTTVIKGQSSVTVTGYSTTSAPSLIIDNSQGGNGILMGNPATPTFKVDRLGVMTTAGSITAGGNINTSGQVNATGSVTTQGNITSKLNSQLSGGIMTANVLQSTAIGNGATVGADYAIQIGSGVNNTSNTINVGGAGNGSAAATQAVNITGSNTNVSASQTFNVNAGQQINLTSNTVIGGTGKNTTINGAATTINTSYTNINSAGGVTITTPNVQINGGQNITGNQSVAGYATFGQVATFNSGIDNSGKRITNLGNGINGTDAVNLNQLNGVATTAKNYTDAETARATAAEGALTTRINATDSNLTAEVNTRTSEVARVDSRVDSTNTTVANNATTAANATAQVQTNLDATNGRTANITTTATGTSMGGKKVENVADGVDGKDAVNVDQLNLTKQELVNINNNTASTTLNTSKTYTDNRVNAETARAQQAEANLQKNINAVGAMAMATAASSGSTIYNPNKKSSLNLGVGNYKGASAVSVGLSHFVNDSVKVNVNVAGGTDGGVGIGAGASFAF